MSSSNMLLFGTDWATKVVSIRPHSDAHRKRSSCGGVTASLQAANSNSLSSATLLLRHRLMQRSYYGVLAQCFVAGPWIYSNTSTGSSMAGRINCSKQQREPLSAHRNLHDITRTTSSRRGLERMNDTGIQVHPFTSWSSSWSSLSTVMPNSSDNHRLLELLLASIIGLATASTTLTYNWYDSNGPATTTDASAEQTPKTAPRFSVSRRTPGVCTTTTTANAAAAVNGNGNKIVTRKPYDISVRAIRGGRFTMEDEYFVGNGGRFAAVFDGHGGSGVSGHLKATLFDTVNDFLRQKHWEVDDVRIQQYNGKEQSNSNNSEEDKNAPHMMASDVVKTMQDDQKYFQEADCIPSVASHVAALRAGFEKIEQDVIANNDLAFQGSTAVAVIVHESDDGSRTILSANVGDSRAILSRSGKAVDLTRDHKPNDEREKKRILAMGETIEWDAECMVHRVRNLSLARAIGDRYAKPAVSPEVEIKHFPVSEGEDEFVVLASDGLWDVMTSQDVVSFVHNYIENEVSRMNKDNAENYRLVLRKNMAKLLAREAIRKGSTDNICVLMVWL